MNIILGLSTSYVARNFSESCSKVAQKRSKVAFCNESCSKVAPKKQTNKKFCCSFPLFGLLQKYANCTTKVRYLSFYCAILRRNQRC